MPATAARPADHHREDTTAPEFTFVPADYIECSDEMLMDDATASDTGEVTIEVSSEPPPAMPPATT